MPEATYHYHVKVLIFKNSHERYKCITGELKRLGYTIVLQKETS